MFQCRKFPFEGIFAFKYPKMGIIVSFAVKFLDGLKLRVVIYCAWPFSMPLQVIAHE